MCDNCARAGVGKGYYVRRKIGVTTATGEHFEPEVYAKVTSSDKLREGPFLEEYTLEFHRANYRAIRHIMVRVMQTDQKARLRTTAHVAVEYRALTDTQVKQQLYMGTQLGRVET